MLFSTLVLPSLNRSFIVLDVSGVTRISCRGEYIGEEEIFILSFSPLYFVFSEVSFFLVSDVGEIHRVVENQYSRSPLSEPEP